MPHTATPLNAHFSHRFLFKKSEPDNIAAPLEIVSDECAQFLRAIFPSERLDPSDSGASPGGARLISYRFKAKGGERV